MKITKCLLPICAITVIVLVCFGRTLGSYFVADDFGQVAYASDIAGGNWSALASNFTGNYMQNPSMKIYRPCLLLSLLFDWSVWHTNAFGYFLSNILFFIACSAMLYFLLREITRHWEDRQSVLFSILSAGLFASYPLHCESISFISGRDNIISAFFYLFSMWCFVRKGLGPSKKWLILGILSFWVAMLSKEMAIGLPVVLTAMALLIPEAFKSDSSTDQQANKPSLKEKLVLALKLTAPIWINTILYLFVRYLALGTITGGYTGSIGGGLMSNLFERWANIGTLLKIIYPLNNSVFGLTSWNSSILSTLYTAIVLLLTLRLLNGRLSFRWLGFLVLWALTTMAPMYQLWALGSNLEGARFFYFFSIPLAIFIPFLLFYPGETRGSFKNASLTEVDRIELLEVVTVCALIAVNANIAFKNNIPWVHAGQQSKACSHEASKLAKETPPGKRMVLLGIPKDEGGAHIIYNGATFNTMISRPFTAVNNSDKFVTLDPLFFGLPQLINAQRLKRLLSDPSVSGLFVWNGMTKTFDSLPRPINRSLADHSSENLVQTLIPEEFANPVSLKEHRAHSDSSQIWLHDHKKGCELLLAPLNIDPYQYDFVEFKLTGSLPKEPISVFWRGTETNDLDWSDFKYQPEKMVLNAEAPQDVRIRLSNYWRWFAQGNITQLHLQLVPDQIVEIKGIRLVSGKLLMPTIVIRGVQEGNTGVYSIGKKDVELDFDANAIGACTDVKIEISKPMYFFEGLSDSESEQAVMTTILEHGRKGQVTISDKTFGAPGYYQLRALCLNSEGRQIGECSDPLTIFF